MKSKMSLIPKQLFLLQKIIGVYSITIIRVCGTIKIERKRSLGRLGGRWEDGIKTDLNETGWEGVDLIHVPRDRNK